MSYSKSMQFVFSYLYFQFLNAFILSLMHKGDISMAIYDIKTSMSRLRNKRERRTKQEEKKK